MSDVNSNDVFIKFFNPSEDGKELLIDFHNLLEFKDVKNPNINTFNISRKRIYLSIVNSMVNDLNHIANQYPEILKIYYDIHDRILNGIDPKDLITLVNDNIIKDEKIQLIIRELVNKEHTISIESRDKNEELQFKDSYAKLIICISIMSRIVIPILCSYIERQNSLAKFKRGEINNYDYIFLDVFYNVFNVFKIDENNDEIELFTKILRFISTSVDNTLYSDKIIWQYLQNMSINEDILSLKLFKQIIKDIIPKLEINKSIVSFLHVVTKKQIEYQFTQKFKIQYKSITSIRTDSEGNNINPFVRIEQKLVRANELDYVLSKQNIHSYLNQFPNITKEEILYYMDAGLKINTLQVKLMNFYANKFIGKGTNIFNISKLEYFKLLLITKKWLAEKNFDLLSIIITCNIRSNTSTPARKGIVRTKLFNEMVKTRVYNNIYTKYSIIDDKLNENNFILSFINEILNTEFDYINDYGEDQSIIVDFNEIPPKLIVTELLSFLDRI